MLSKLIAFFRSDSSGPSRPDPTLSESPVAMSDSVSDAPAHAPARSPNEAVVIDVRTESEFQGGAVQGALNLPLAQLEQLIASHVPNQATPVVLYCASGGRSGMGCMMLQRMGYSQVSNAGGLYLAAAALGRQVV